MLVSVNREEWWPIYEIKQDIWATKEIPEELYHRYLKVQIKFDKVQKLLSNVYNDHTN